MVTDQQVRRFLKLAPNTTLEIAAAKSGMDPKTARKYQKLERLPSEVKSDHTWKTRKDPFVDVWFKVEKMISAVPGYQSKTLFHFLQREYPGKFADGQIRTLQRRIKYWRATGGPSRDAIFPQTHYPGDIGASDFTSMNKLGITINGVQFDHLVYHFVLTYSNWETGTICFSENFESLSEGIQNAFWELGGVTKRHLTDCLSTAINKSGNPEVFTSRYSALLRHYNLKGHKTNPGSPNENGDIEVRNHFFKEAVEQSLLLRGNRDFASREEYRLFLKELFHLLNFGREKRFAEDLAELGRLPMKRLESYKRIDKMRVRKSSTIRVNHNTYSVNSRLINEHVNIRLYMEHLEVRYGQKVVEIIPRLLGENKHYINYRHIIDSFLKKPGAFANYKWREDMFPTIRFRMAYDSLVKRHTLSVAAKEYLKILELAAKNCESAVDAALKILINKNKKIEFSVIEKLYKSKMKPSVVENIVIYAPDLKEYDNVIIFRSSGA